MKKNILVLGASGQLGSEVKKVCHQYSGATFQFAGRDEIDLEDPDLTALLDFRCPDMVINLAAYTAVDIAEDDSTKAYAINSLAVKSLAQACHNCGATLIHISTDYVYHISKRGPLLETEACRPKGVYAKSKYKGEEYIRNILYQHIIIRTSWLYSTFGNNFVKTMLKLGEKHTELSIIDDQIGAPTYAEDLAHVICKIASSVVSNPEKDVYGTYNYANRGMTTWYDFASKIFEIKNIPIKLKKVTTEEYGAKAPRPHWSVFSLNKIIRTFDLTIPHWVDGLHRMLKNLDKNN